MTEGKQSLGRCFSCCVRSGLLKTNGPHLYECSDCTQWAGAGYVLVLRVGEDGGVAGTPVHLHLHQTVPVPGTVLHQVDQQAHTLDTVTEGQGSAAATSAASQGSQGGGDVTITKNM